jgi:hypothetical protein
MRKRFRFRFHDHERISRPDVRGYYQSHDVQSVIVNIEAKNDRPHGMFSFLI